MNRKVRRQMLRRGQVESKTTLSTSAIYRMIKEGKFPRPVKLGDSTVAWFEDEIDGWLEDRERAAI